MFQALLEGVLQRILGEYVEAIDPKKLNLSVSVIAFLTLIFEPGILGCGRSPRSQPKEDALRRT